MFIKLIEIYGEMKASGHRYYHLREVVINKKNIISMLENTQMKSNERDTTCVFPDGFNTNQQYTNIYLLTNSSKEVVCTVIGSLDHVYKLLETDSMLNHRQTLRG